jgi:hypothetical protein
MGSNDLVSARQTRPRSECQKVGQADQSEPQSVERLCTKAASRIQLRMLYASFGLIIIHQFSFMFLSRYQRQIIP